MTGTSSVRFRCEERVEVARQPLDLGIVTREEYFHHHESSPYRPRSSARGYKCNSSQMERDGMLKDVVPRGLHIHRPVFVSVFQTRLNSSMLNSSRTCTDPMNRSPCQILSMGLDKIWANISWGEEYRSNIFNGSNPLSLTARAKSSSFPTLFEKTRDRGYHWGECPFRNEAMQQTTSACKTSAKRMSLRSARSTRRSAATLSRRVFPRCAQFSSSDSG